MTLINTVFYERGSQQKNAFIFSCPGKKERDAVPQGPAKGQTGSNLSTLLEILREEYNMLDMNRDSITISNSWPKVEFKNRVSTDPDRTEAKIEEIMSQENLDRLALELGSITNFIFASGINAFVTVLALRYAGKLSHSVKVIKLRHLGLQSLNQIKVDKDNVQIIGYKKAADKPLEESRTLRQIRTENTRKRIEKIAYEIHEELGE